MLTGSHSSPDESYIDAGARIIKSIEIFRRSLIGILIAKPAIWGKRYHGYDDRESRRLHDQASPWLDEAVGRK